MVKVYRALILHFNLCSQSQKHNIEIVVLYHCLLVIVCWEPSDLISPVKSQLEITWATNKGVVFPSMCVSPAPGSYAQGCMANEP